MSYLVYDKDNELIDVLEISAEDVESYLKLNPTHTVEFEDNISFYDEGLEEDEFFDDDSDEDQDSW